MVTDGENNIIHRAATGVLDGLDVVEWDLVQANFCGPLHTTLKGKPLGRSGQLRHHAKHLGRRFCRIGHGSLRHGEQPAMQGGGAVYQRQVRLGQPVE